MANLAISRHDCVCYVSQTSHRADAMFLLRDLLEALKLTLILLIFISVIVPPALWVFNPAELEKLDLKTAPIAAAVVFVIFFAFLSLFLLPRYYYQLFRISQKMKVPYRKLLDHGLDEKLIIVTGWRQYQEDGRNKAFEDLMEKLRRP